MVEVVGTILSRTAACLSADALFIRHPCIERRWVMWCTVHVGGVFVTLFLLAVLCVWVYLINTQ